MNGNRTADAVVAIELFRNRQVSNVATGRFLVLNNQPPLLNQPRNNAQIPPIQPQNLLFSWTPRHTTAPTGLVYELFLYEVPDGEDPAVVVNSGLPAVQRLLSSQPSFLYGPGQLPLRVGQRYAWQVRVESLDQQVAFSNGGLSDVGSFVYGAPPCPPPAQLEAVVSAEAGEVQLRWQPPLTTDPPVQSYLLSYAAHPNGLPTQRSLTATEYLLLQLPAEQPYQWRVQSVCPQGPSVAVVGSFELPAAVQAEPSWLSDPQIAYEPPQDPLPNPEVMQSSERIDPSEEAAKEPDAFDGLFDEPMTALVPSQSDTTKKVAVSVLPESPTVEQLKAALKIKPPDCAGIASQYQCGNHDNVPTYSGEIIPVSAGDELAMNSLIISVVDIDGSGNGSGLIKMPMMNNIKLGLTLTGIKVAKGGCIVAGKAELSGVSASILNDQQRAALQKAYAVYSQVLDVADANAGAIADGINATRKAIEDLAQRLSEKKRNTKTLLKTFTPDKEALLLKNCQEIATDSKTLQDSLQTMIGLVKSGKVKANLGKLLAACQENVAFMNRLAPALADCQGLSQPAPLPEAPCKGPCAEPWQLLPENIAKVCHEAIAEAMGVKSAPETLMVDGTPIIAPNGSKQTIPNQAIPLIDENGKIDGFIYDEKVYKWLCCQTMGYFEKGKTPSQYTSHIAIFEDIYNKKTQPFSWAMKKALVDAGQSFIDFGRDPVNNNPIVAIAKLVAQIPNFSVDKTIDYLSKLDKDDAYYVSASVILAAVGSGGVNPTKAKDFYNKLNKGKNVPTVLVEGKNIFRGFSVDYSKAKNIFDRFRENQKYSLKKKYVGKEFIEELQKFTNRNLAYFEGEINGIRFSADDVKLSGNSFKGEKIFDSYKVDKLGRIDTEGAWSREFDTEYVGLSEIAQKLGGEKGVIYKKISGQITIASELPYCISCQGVIQDFAKMFPNVKIYLVDGIKTVK